MVKIYHNPRCRKSREALALIKEKEKNVVIKEYLKEPPTSEELQAIIKLLNIKPYDLIRRNETEFKEYFKGKHLSDEEWLQAMVDYPKLIERPIIIVRDKAVIGRIQENILSIL